MWNTLLGLACSLYRTQNTWTTTFKERENTRETNEKKGAKMQEKNWKTKHSNAITLYIYFMLFYPRNIRQKIYFCCCSLLLLSLSLFPSLQQMCSRLHFYCSHSPIYLRANWITMRSSSKHPARRIPHAFLLVSPRFGSRCESNHFFDVNLPCAEATFEAMRLHSTQNARVKKNHAQYWLPNNGNILTTTFEISRWGIIVFKYLLSN